MTSQDPDLFKLRDTPQLKRAIVTRGGESLAVSRYAYRTHGPNVRLDHNGLLPHLRVPDANAPIVTSTDQEPSGRRKKQSIHSAIVASKATKQLWMRFARRLVNAPTPTPGTFT